MSATLYFLGTFWIRHKNFMDVGSNPTGSKFQRIRGRVVEGTGLIIHFHKNVAGSNPVGCNFFRKFLLYFSNLRFKRLALPVRPLKKYNFARRTLDDCFFVIDKIFGEFNKKTCSTPIP